MRDVRSSGRQEQPSVRLMKKQKQHAAKHLARHCSKKT